MEVFIEKFCRRYNLSETDVKALTEQMQYVLEKKKLLSLKENAIAIYT